MYLVSFEEHGKEPKNLVTATSLAAAQYWVGIWEGIDPFDKSIWEENPESSGQFLYILGDAQYVISSLPHIS